MRLSGWKQLLPTAKIEKMRGNFMHNEKYCSTEGELMEFGERPVQGKRNDIAQLQAKLDAGQRHVSRSIGLSTSVANIQLSHGKIRRARRC